MGLYESGTHSFIVKIWLEETASESSKVLWRGHITHVVSEQRRYLQDLDEIEVFIRPYLKEMGVAFGRDRCIWRWINQWKSMRKSKSSKPRAGV